MIFGIISFSSYIVFCEKVSSDTTIVPHFWFGDGAPNSAVPHVCSDKTRNIPCQRATCVAVFSIYG